MAIPARSIEEMIAEVIEYTRSYVVWRELMQKPNRQVRENHVDFLLTVTNSLVQGFCVHTYQLFDRDSRTKSLLRLIGDLRSSDPSLAQRLESSIHDQIPVLEKVFRIRNNVYAHRNKSQQPQAVFAAAGLTPNKMKAVVHLAQEVVSALAVAAGIDTRGGLEKRFRSHEKWVLDDTRQVVLALKRHSS